MGNKASKNNSSYKSPIERQQEILGIQQHKQSPQDNDYQSQRRAKIRYDNTSWGNRNYSYNSYKKPSLKYRSKKIINSTFDASESESWNKECSNSLNNICELLCIPEVICGIIESYVWTSAVIIKKSYSPNLSETFIKCSNIGTNYKDAINILLIGSDKSGKTNIVSRFYVNAFIEIDIKLTDTTKCICNIDDKVYNLKVIDSGKGFHFLMSEYKKQFVRDAHCIVVVFDLNNKKSYQWIAAHTMIDEFIKIKSIENAKDIPIVIVGTKIDQIDNNTDDTKRNGINMSLKMGNIERLIPIEKIKKDYCFRYNAPYIECSAKCCVNIHHLFNIAVKEAMTYICNFK